MGNIIGEKSEELKKSAVMAPSPILDYEIRLALLKVSKFQNENMRSSHCPKYDQKF